MTNLKAVGWINNSLTQYIDENFLMIKVYFSNEVYYKIQIVIDVHVYK